jgi:peroxiredoxin Q/BCP
MAQNLKPGDPAPEFRVQTAGGDFVGLADLRGKPIVLFFFPKASTPG